MKTTKRLMLAVAFGMSAALLSACGGSGDSKPSTPATPPTTGSKHITIYGTSSMAGSGKKATASRFNLISPAYADSPTAGATDAAQALQAALAAQGVPNTVSVGVMDGAALHDLVMATDNGQMPPAAQHPQPTEWVIENFSIDPTTLTDPTTRAATLAQFQQDLAVFIERNWQAGKRTFIVQPDPVCDATLNNNVNDVMVAETQATGISAATFIYTNGFIMNQPDWKSKMDSTCTKIGDELIVAKTTEIASVLKQYVALDTQPENPRQ